jgi:O-antigen/teichoic acid export membrane protein
MLGIITTYHRAAEARITSMLSNLYRRFGDNWTILTNASSLVGTNAVTSGLGFIYWWAAARMFPPEAVGLASAAISVMMLLGTVSVLGFGTLLIGELPRPSHQKASLIITALLLVGMVGGGLGLLFALVSPWISIDLQALAQSSESVVLFALGVSLTAITLVLDQATIGLLRGELQLGRNSLFAVAKLAALLGAGVWLSGKLGLTIYATWVLGNIISLIPLAGWASLKGLRISDCWPQSSFLRELGRAALEHHLLNLTLQAPTLILPVVVTALLSTRMNAYFYAAWMIADFGFAGLFALTTVLYALSSAEPAIVALKIRATLKLSLVIALLESIVLLVGADYVLRFFGTAYAEQAGWTLRILGLAAFPLIIRNHYVAISRIQGRIASVTLLMLGGGLFELVLAVLGARIGSLLGLSLGWVAAVCLEAVFMAGSVYRAAIPAHAPRGQPAGKVSLPHARGTPASPAGTDEK